MLISFGGASVLQYAFGLAMAWLLLPSDFGWLAFTQSILLIAEIVLQDGFPWSLAREVAKADGSRRGALLRGALLANLVLAAAISLILVILFALGPLRPGLETGGVVAIVALFLPFESLASTVRGYAQGRERFGTVAAIELMEVSCRVPIGIVLVLLGFGVEGAVAGFLAGAILATVLGFYQLGRGLDTTLSGSIDFSMLRGVGPIFGALLGLSLLVNLDLVALKLLSDEPALAGFYQAGRMLANIPYYLVITAIVQVLFVRLANANDTRTIQQVMNETLSLTAILVIPLEIILMLLPRHTLLAFFPTSYAAGAPALRLLAIGNAILIVVAIFSVAFQAIGRARVSALILLAVAFVEPIVLWVLVPARGMLGAASAFIAAAAVALICLTTAYLLVVGARVGRTLAFWLIKYALAAGTGIAAGYAMLRFGLNVYLATTVGGACYLAVLLALRLIRLPELLRIRTSLQKIDKE